MIIFPLEHVLMGLTLRRINLTPSLLGLEVFGIGRGYQVLNEICEQEKEIQVVEASPQPNGKFLIIITGKPQDLFKIKKVISLKEDDQDFFLEEPCDDLLPSLYALNEIKVQESLIVVETDSTLNSLEIADTLQERGCQLIEIKSLRSQSTYSFIVATGRKAKLEKVRSELLERDLFQAKIKDAQVITHPCNNFKSWFE